TAVSLLVAAIFLAPATNTLRPHMFSCLLLAIQLVILRKAGSGSPRLLWFLPLMFAFWVNLHGGFLVGLAVLFLWSAVETVKRMRGTGSAPPPLCWSIFALSGLALMVNPYGYELPLYLLRVSVIPRPDIFEWKPIELLSDLGLLWAAVTLVTLV